MALACALVAAGSTSPRTLALPTASGVPPAVSALAPAALPVVLPALLDELGSHRIRLATRAALGLRVCAAAIVLAVPLAVAGAAHLHATLPGATARAAVATAAALSVSGRRLEVALAVAAAALVAWLLLVGCPSWWADPLRAATDLGRPARAAWLIAAALGAALVFVRADPGRWRSRPPRPRHLLEGSIR